MLRKLSSDSLVYGVLDVLNRVVSVLLVPLYTRVLPPSDFGALDLFTTAGSVAFALLLCGLDSALSFYFNATEDPEERRRIASHAMATWGIVTLVGGGVLALAHRPLAQLIAPGAPTAGTLMLLTAANLPLQAVASAQTLLLRLHFARRRYVALSLTTLVATVVLNLVFVLWARMGVAGILLAQLVARAMTVPIGFVLLRADLGTPRSTAGTRALLRYGLPLVLPNLVYWFALFAERFTLSRFATLADVGVYGVAARIASATTLASGAIDIAWMPFALSVQRRDDAPALYARALTLYLLVVGLFGTLVALFSREALELFTRAPYYGASVLVGPIAAGLIMRGAVNILAIGVMLRQRTGTLANVSLASCVIGVGALFVLVPQLGALGAALATLVGRLAAFGLLLHFTRRVYPMPIELRTIARIAVLYTAAVLSDAALRSVSPGMALAVKVLLVVPLLIAGVFATGAIRPAERREMRAYWRRTLGRAA
jgi:O-antigen/teichoic acid export membrane protein